MCVSLFISASRHHRAAFADRLHAARSRDHAGDLRLCSSDWWVFESLYEAISSQTTIIMENFKMVSILCVLKVEHTHVCKFALVHYVSSQVFPALLVNSSRIKQA